MTDTALISMNVSYFQLWLFYGGLWLVVVKLTKGRFSPAIAFFGTWSISLGLLSLGSLNPDFAPPDLSRSACLYLMYAGCSFFGGTLLAHGLGRTVRQRVATSTQRDDRAETRESFNIAALKTLSLVALVFTILHIYQQAPDLRSYLTNGQSIREKLTDITAENTSWLAATATYAALAVIPVAGIYWLRRRKIWWWMIIPILSVGLLALLSIGKFLFIFLGLTFLNMALYQRATNSASRFRHGPIFVAVAVIFCSFFVITELRNRTDVAVEEEAHSGLLFTLYHYATGYVPAFGVFYDEYLRDEVSTSPVNPDYSEKNAYPGNQTFSGIYRLLGLIGLLKRSASNRYEGTFNVYTIHRDLIMDFGTAGNLVAFFLIGFSVTLFFRLCDRSKASTVVLLSLLTTQMEFTLIYSLFGFLFYPLLLLFCPILAGLSGRHGAQP
jgi:oligosaccharide repeat unit polymerase